MSKRDVLNFAGVKIGELEMPNETTEEQWAEKLAVYAVNPLDGLLQRSINDSIKDRRLYADDLIERFKSVNIESGITAMQALWLQHRMRALEVNVSGLPMVIDMMNLIVSGDAEVACIALQYCVPDDMTMPYHYFSAARRDWLVADLKKFLRWT